MPNLKTPLFLTAAVILTRLPFTSRLLYNMDSVQFALAADKFDVTLHQPQPPGYFLYVLLGRLAATLTGDANAGFVLISMIFSALTVIALYYMGREFFDEDTGLAAAVFAITSPLFWFHGEVALSYMPEAFMSALFAYLCFRMRKGEGHLFWLASVTLGLAGGVRQNTMVFLAPLWLYSMMGLSPKRVAASLLIFSATVLAWYVPMLEATGGYSRYNAALKAHWLDANWHGIHLSWISFNAKYMLYFISAGLGVALAPLLLNTYLVLSGKTKRPSPEASLFFALWLLPSFLFHLIIFTHPAVPGHSLIYMVGLLVLAGKGLTVISSRMAGILAGFPAVKVKAVNLACLASINALVFLFYPYPISAKAIRGHDKFLSSYIETVRKNFPPENTEIIASSRFILSYRHVMYYLPEYRVYDTTWISTPEGPRLFWGQNRKTYKASFIRPLPTTRNFVDFINYGPEDVSTLPEDAKVLPVQDGCLLVYYTKPGDLKKVPRIAPFLDKSI